MIEKDSPSAGPPRGPTKGAVGHARAAHRDHRGGWRGIFCLLSLVCGL